MGTGLRAYDPNRSEPYLKQHVGDTDQMNLIDFKAGNDHLNIYMPLMDIGQACAKFSAKERPVMEKVCTRLSVF